MAKAMHQQRSRVVKALRGCISSLDWRRNVLYFGFLIIFVVFSVSLYDYGFLSIPNVMNILRHTAIITVISVGMTFVIGAAEIDLSVGAVAGLSACVTALALRGDGLFGWGAVGGVIAGLTVGIVIGLLNGYITTRVGIPSFLVTLAMMGIAKGIAMWSTETRPIAIVNDGYNDVFGAADVGPIPSLVLWTLVVVIVGHMILRRTAFGRKVLATGGNPIAASFTGVRIKNVKMTVLFACSMLAALGGMLYAGRMNTGRFQLGEGDELSVIAAVILGGTNLYGGRATVIGTVVGSLMIGMINNGLLLMGIEYPQQLIIRGIIIILAVALARR